MSSIGITHMNNYTNKFILVIMWIYIILLVINLHSFLINFHCQFFVFFLLNQFLFWLKLFVDVFQNFR